MYTLNLKVQCVAFINFEIQEKSYYEAFINFENRETVMKLYLNLKITFAHLIVQLITLPIATSAGQKSQHSLQIQELAHPILIEQREIPAFPDLILPNRLKRTTTPYQQRKQRTLYFRFVPSTNVNGEFLPLYDSCWRPQSGSELAARPSQFRDSAESLKPLSFIKLNIVTCPT